MKINVMIVDDEPIAAKSIEFILTRNRTDTNIVGIYHSGRTAIEAAIQLHPDVIIMDIHMPGINGLEAMRQIRNYSPNVFFIIISAYSDFSYALEAISIGTVNYLLKPVKQNEFKQAFEKLAHSIHSTRHKQNINLQQQERLENITPIISKDFVHSLMPQKHSKERLIATASFLNYLNTTGYVMVAESIGKDAYEDLTAYINIVKRFHCCEVAITQDNLAVAYITKNSSTKNFLIQKQAIQLAENILSTAKENDNHLILSIGNCDIGPIKARHSCTESLFALEILKKNRRNKSNLKLITFWDLENNPESRYIIEKFYDENSLANEIIEAVSIIEKANLYLENHFQEDILLEDVANKVNLSPYYFSRFYKEHAGKNFSDALVQLRIKKAKALLENDENNIKDVAFRVGYNDASYFSRVFKKEVGISASKYKEQLYE